MPQGRAALEEGGGGTQPPSDSALAVPARAAAIGAGASTSLASRRHLNRCPGMMPQRNREGKEPPGCGGLHWGSGEGFVGAIKQADKSA